MAIQILMLNIDVSRERSLILLPGVSGGVGAGRGCGTKGNGCDAIGKSEGRKRKRWKQETMRDKHPEKLSQKPELSSLSQ